MTERNEHKNKKYQDGDIYLNPCFGDLWVVDGTSFIKINDGYAIDLDEPEGFIKVGHIDGVIKDVQRFRFNGYACFFKCLCCRAVEELS